MESSRVAALPPARSGEEYRARIPRRIAALVAGLEREFEPALGAGDLEELERLAGRVNALSIDGRPIAAREVEIAGAPTAEEVLSAGKGADPRGAVLEDLLAGRVVAQLFFAGAATRFSRVSGGPLYLLDIWEAAERVLAEGESALPQLAPGMKREEFLAIREAVRRAAAGCPHARRLRVALGPRLLLGYRSALARIARQAGEAPDVAAARARLVVHVADAEEGRRILEDLSSHDFYGFDPANVLGVPQPRFGGFRVAGGRVSPLAGSPEFPYGHGYSTMQLAQPGAALSWQGRAWVRLPEDPLGYLGRGGEFLIRTHRVNDLTQLSPEVLDLERLAAGRALLDRGHAVVIELVANPSGQKGGNWVSLGAAGHRFLIEGLNAKTEGWPEFLERHSGTPYNAFRNIYRGSALKRILGEHALPDHLRARKLAPQAAGGSSAGLYLESVTGDLTQIFAARAAAFRRDEREEIHDMKELRDLPEGVRFAAAQDQDEEFRRAVSGKA